jgi:hypothetical protein
MFVVQYKRFYCYDKKDGKQVTDPLYGSPCRRMCHHAIASHSGHVMCMPLHVIRCHDMSCCVVSWYDMSCYVMSRLLCHVMSRRTTFIVSCHVMPYLVMSRHSCLCRVMSGHVMSSYVDMTWDRVIRTSMTFLIQKMWVWQTGTDMTLLMSCLCMSCHVTSYGVLIINRYVIQTVWCV